MEALLKAIPTSIIVSLVLLVGCNQSSTFIEAKFPSSTFFQHSPGASTMSTSTLFLDSRVPSYGLPTAFHL
jgi:hypothetical protein